MVRTCECCGHPLPDAEAQLDLTRRQRDIFKAVQKAGRAGLTIASLVDKVYANEASGGPDTANNVVQVQKLYINKKIAAHGLRITTTKGHGALWRLEKIDV